MLGRFKKLETGETIIVPPVPIPFYCERAETNDIIARFKAPVDGELKYISITVDKAEMADEQDELIARFEGAKGIGISLAVALKQGDTTFSEIIPVKARECYVFRNVGCPVSGVWVTMMFEVR